MKRRNIVGVLAAAGLIATKSARCRRSGRRTDQGVAAGHRVGDAHAGAYGARGACRWRPLRAAGGLAIQRIALWPAAVANVNRSLGEAPNTEGKVLAGTGRCWTGVCILGLTLDELADVARANTGRKVTVLRDLGEDEFREHLRRSNDPGRRYIVNFSRKRIFGAGVGHHSPIGGYLEPEDLVFVLDVNRDYQPWLVEGTACSRPWTRSTAIGSAGCF